MNEIWKEIRGYKDYMVSSTGKVRSRERYVKHMNGNRLIKGKLLKGIDDKGYLIVNLFKDGIGKKHKVHRLVAEAFIPNPENKETVNHIDTNKKNNNIDNLEWNTNVENIKHAWKNGLYDDNTIIYQQKIKCVENDKVYNSANQAKKELKLSVTAGAIRNAANPMNRSKTAGGYHWIRIE